MKRRHHIRICNRVCSFLADRDAEEASFHQIKDHINTTTRHGTTSPELSNLLVKDPRFERTDTTQITIGWVSHWRCSSWRLANGGGP